MTTAQREGRLTLTEVDRATDYRFSVAPNGSSSGWDYHTRVTLKQTWTDDPRNGIYASRSYRVRHYYISPTAPRHTYAGQFIGSDSQPW